MIDKDYIELGQERKLLDEGHNLSIVSFYGVPIGYLGQVGFDGIRWCAPVLSAQKPKVYSRLIVPRRRTATAIVANGKVCLFCARKVGFSKKDIYRKQRIEYWASYIDTSLDKKLGDITDGSAPFIFYYDGLYYLYFHRRKDNNHKILVRCAQTLDGLKNATERIILEADHSFSMPSVAYLNGWFWLTCEEMVEGHWRTVLYKSQTPEGLLALGGFKYVGVLIDAPCVYQHVIDGKYFITYSRKEGDKWGIWIKEQI